jgi:tyrosyl-tRNA synthetase
VLISIAKAEAFRYIMGLLMKPISKVFEDLEARGIVYQVTDPELRAILDQGSAKPITLYVGFDPTADSLHIGSLMGLVTLRRLQMAGHRPIAVVGGATGMIGDPSGKSQERQLLDQAQIEKNVKGITRVVQKFLSFEGPHAALLLDNYSWFKEMNMIQFLRDVGKHFTVNYMVAKESVRARLEDREHGLSYTEFTYMLLQAYDFYVLNQKYGCSVQMGGADQWGNITAGNELIRRMNAQQGREAEPVYGLTWPLVTKADGTKFGKTESGAVWLTADRTSPYQFYQFFIRTSDEEVIKLLKYFTFLSVEQIQELEHSLKTSPEKRLAQAALAREVTILVHGEQEYQKAVKASEALFSQEIGQLDAQSLLEVLADAPSTPCQRSELNAGLMLLDLLVKTGLCSSKGEAKKDIQGGGIYLNNLRMSDMGFKLGVEHLIGGRYLVLRKGKKNHHLVSFEE